MSDSNKPKPLPPDDFGATTPNIKIPKDALPDSAGSSSNDWEKTNYNYSPKDLERDAWSKNAYNAPKPTPPPKDDWGTTRANINLPDNQPNQFGESFDDEFGSRDSNFGKTSVGVNIPRNEPPKYQEPPSAEKEVVQEETKKGGIPGWLLASAGLLTMFFFTVAVLLAVYFIFLGNTGFEVAIKGVPVRSDIKINGSYWGVTGADGLMRLPTLKAGEVKKIEIVNPAWKCQPIDITLDEAKDGNVIQKPASCANTGTPPTEQKPPPECLSIKSGDFATSRRCAHTELDKLEKAGTWTVDQLLYAMNLYIINFDVNKFDIKPIDMQFIERAAGFMKKLPPNTIIEVGGHTDSDGTDARNQPLSENRAKSVMDALIAKGIPSAMLKSQGYGSKRPKDGNTNANKDEKFRNRRIEYTVLSK